MGSPCALLRAPCLRPACTDPDLPLAPLPRLAGTAGTSRSPRMAGCTPLPPSPPWSAIGTARVTGGSHVLACSADKSIAPKTIEAETNL